jgi:hypothetical protein
MGRIAALAALGWCLTTVATRADEEAELRAVLARAVQAHGGAEKLGALRAAVWESAGKLYGANPALDYAASSARSGPDRAALTVETTVGGQRLRRTAVVDRDRGWVRLNDRVEEMDAPTLAEERERAYAAWIASLTPLIDGQFQLRTAREIVVNGRPAVGVRIASPGHRDVVLYFDREAGLLVKKETLIQDPHGKDPEEMQETYYGAYRLVDGVRIAFHIQVHRKGELSLDSRLTTVRLSPQLDDHTFARPE